MEIFDLHDALLTRSAIATRLPAFRVSWSLPGVIKERGDDYWMSTGTKWTGKKWAKNMNQQISPMWKSTFLWSMTSRRDLEKGWATFSLFFNLVEMNLFAQAIQLLTKLQVAVWANRKKTVSLQFSFSFAVSNSSASCAVIQLKFTLHLSL